MGIYCEYVNGWESGSSGESGYGKHNDDSSNSDHLGLLLPVAVPSPPAGINMGSYCQFYDHSSEQSSTNSRIPLVTAHAQGSIGFMWRPQTNPSSLGGVGPPTFVTMLGIDNTSLGGISVGWNTSKQLCIADYGGTSYKATSTTFDAASPAWYWVVLGWDNVAHSETPSLSNYVRLGIWDDSRNLVEMISIAGEAMTSGLTLQNLVFGSVWPTSEIVGFYIDNVMVVKGSAWPPIAPDFDSVVMSSINLNSTAMVKYDGNDNGSPAEVTMIDEIPAVDTDDYLKVVANSSLITQYWNPVAFGTLGTVHAVGATMRHWQNSFAGAGGQIGIRLGTAQTVSSLLFVRDRSDARADSVWGYRAYVFRATVPGAVPVPWTSDNVTNTLIVTSLRPIGTDASRECRVSQVVMYCVHGGDIFNAYPAGSVV